MNPSAASSPHPSTLGRFAAGVESALEALAALSLFAVMIIFFTDVGGRYLASKPYAWSYELIGMYLMPAMFYFALPAAYAHGHHVCVDLLRGKMSPALIHLVETLGCAAAAVVFALIVSLFQASAREKFVADAVVMGVVEWPSWIPDALVALGSFAITLRLLSRAAVHLGALARGHASPVSGYPPERQP